MNERLAAYPDGHVFRPICFHSGAGLDGVVTCEHLDESMTFLLVDYTRLHQTVFFKELPELVLGNSGGNVNKMNKMKGWNTGGRLQLTLHRQQIMSC